MSVAQKSFIDLVETPLPQLLHAYRVELTDTCTTDRMFLGNFVEHQDGSRVLSMPVGRSAFERDTVARILLAEALGLDAPPVPAPLTVSTL